jgi:hypothetical protein
MDEIKKYGALIALGAGAVLVIGYFAKKAVSATATAINPVNHDNVFSNSVSAVGGALTNDSSWSLGQQLFDWVHPSDASAAAHDLALSQSQATSQATTP